MSIISQFNPKTLTCIRLDGADSEQGLGGNQAKDCQLYVHNHLTSFINKGEGYTLAYGPWEDMHSNWFSKDNIKWDGRIKNFGRKTMKENEWRFTESGKRPDFIFVENRKRENTKKKNDTSLSKANKNGKQSESSSGNQSETRSEKQIASKIENETARSSKKQSKSSSVKQQPSSSKVGLVEAFSNLDMSSEANDHQLNEVYPCEYIIWELKKAWATESFHCHECQSPCESPLTWYNYFVSWPDESIPAEDLLMHGENLFNEYKGKGYIWVESKGLSKCKKRAENQAMDYAELLKSAIPNPSAAIYYRSVIFVLYDGENKIKNISFGNCKQLS